MTLLSGRPGTQLSVEGVNGRPGLVVRRQGLVLAVVGVSATGPRITVLWIVLNPAKLRGWQR
jgi:RNA polymerase sigma-70 factor (ECF subfamily)